MPELHNLFNSLTGRGGKRNKKDECNEALYHAAKNGSLNKVKELLKAGADPNVQNEHHLTPLHQAAYWGELEIVELLLEHGARIDLDNGKGWTALHSAAISGGLKTRKEVIEKLIEHGADAKKVDKHGWTPEDYMTLWEENAAAADKLKKYLECHDCPPLPDGTLPKKHPRITTPKH